jgi:hypothetical protein
LVPYIGVGRALIVLEIPMYLPQEHFRWAPAAHTHRKNSIEREVPRSGKAHAALIGNQNPFFAMAFNDGHQSARTAISLGPCAIIRNARRLKA